MQQSVERAGIPVAIHVTFAQTQRTLRQYPWVKTGIVDPQVPGTTTADLHVGFGEQHFDTALETDLVHDLPAGSPHSNNPAYSGARYGRSTSIGTSTLCVPSA